MHIVSFSSGLSSAIAALRVIERYGADNARVVFMDTLFEDDDNYRFMADFSRRFGVQIETISDGRTPYELFSGGHIIPNHRTTPCTRVLKIELFRAFLAQLEKPITIHIGYDYSEMHRCGPTQANYEGLGYSVDFPLLWKPYEFRDYPTLAREVWGVEPPRMYKLGYTHANCGGRCVKQGHGDWLRTLINFPARYAEIEEWERNMRKNETNANYAILRTQTLAEYTPLTLQELRERYESKQTPTLFEMDAESGCVVCGIGG